MISPDLPECWYILALLEMKLDWPWREAVMENMEEEIWPYGTAEALVLTETEWGSVKTEQRGMWFTKLPVITPANVQSPWISV